MIKKYGFRQISKNCVLTVVKVQFILKEICISIL